MFRLFGIWIIAALAASAPVMAADTESAPWTISNGQAGGGLYVPRDIQLTYQKGTRSRDGKPGPNYWQNHSAHTIKITVSPPGRRIEGEQEIIYTNNSPDALDFLVFRLYLNAHQPEAMRDRPYPSDFLNSGITVDSISINDKAVDWSKSSVARASMNGPGSTVHAVDLEKPLAPKSSVKIKMRWSYELARDGGWKEGLISENSYFLAYFFPRISNYSDYNGWDVIPFTTGREFNNDFADFNVEVNVPRDFVVWATGDLTNSTEVLQAKVAKALKASMTSDKVTTLAEAADVKAGKVTARGDRLIWKWQASNVPDFAIGLSNEYRWDASSVVVDPATGRRTSVQAAYSDAATDFKSTVDLARKTMAFASTKYPGVPYPWPKSTVFLGNADEEYPMMVNDSSNAASGDGGLLPAAEFSGFVAAHEILHSWFPFYMGINEKRYPFMDEGWTTAFEYLRNTEAVGKAKADALFQYMRVDVVGWQPPLSGNELPIIIPQDSLYGETPVFGFNQYGKAALGYLALRDLMGEADFKKALHVFMDRWHGKRPLPWDMFNSFNDACVGNHNWFFTNWFFGFNYMDLGLGAVSSAGGMHSVQVHNKGGMAMPFDLVFTYDDGSTERVHRTPAVWKDTPRMTEVSLPSTKALRAVVLDTEIFKDFYPADNSWQADKASTARP